MLTFFRPAFKSGMMVIKDKDAQGNDIKHILKPFHNRQDIDFIIDEAFVAATYPEWFMTKADYNAKKAAYKKAKKDKKTFVRS